MLFKEIAATRHDFNLVRDRLEMSAIQFESNDSESCWENDLSYIADLSSVDFKGPHSVLGGGKGADVLLRHGSSLGGTHFRFINSSSVFVNASNSKDNPASETT